MSLIDLFPAGSICTWSLCVSVVCKISDNVFKKRKYSWWCQSRGTCFIVYAFYFSSFLLCDTLFNYDLNSSGWFTIWRLCWRSYWWAYLLPSGTWPVMIIYIYIYQQFKIVAILSEDMVWIWRLSIVFRYNFFWTKIYCF